jgi:hypothetical protein
MPLINVKLFDEVNSVQLLTLISTNFLGCPTYNIFGNQAESTLRFI